MQLDEILGEYSIKAISQKTKISEKNIEIFFTSSFDKLKKVKALGFISILERDYKVDLSTLRDEALAFYAENIDEKKTIELFVEKKKRKSKYLLFIILGLLAYASWYFFTQVNQKRMNELFVFSEEQIRQIFTPKENDIKQESSSKNEITTKYLQEQIKQTFTPKEDDTSVKDKIDSEKTTLAQEGALDVDTETYTKKNSSSIVVNENNSNKEITGEKSVTIAPLGRLWFGLINIETKKRDYFSVAEKFELDYKKSWLLATSAAPFSLLYGDEVKVFNSGQEHYFKIDRSGIKKLSKVEYIALGGWKHW